MPKAKLIFDLNDEFEVDAFNRATSADQAYRVIYELQNLLRNAERYDHIDGMQLNDEQKIVIDKLREELYNLLSTFNVNMENYK